MMSLGFTMCLNQHLSKTDANYKIRAHSGRSSFSISGKSDRCFNQSLLNVPVLQAHAADKLVMFSPMVRQQYANFSSLVRKASENINQLEVEIISTENIKPAAPTPKHLRTHQLSIIDQVLFPIYTPFVYFYSNNNQKKSKVMDLDDLPLRRTQLLKRSLSETLTRFYPLAGKIKDYRHIDCNDDGVYCIEAKVNQSLSDFLSQPGNKCVQPLLPFGSSPIEMFSKTYVLMIQLTTFSCGGISIGLCASHKIIDGSSYATFLRAWADTAAGRELSSQYISPSVFPSAPAIPESMQLTLLSGFVKTGRSTTKRFVFRASSLAQLKKKGGASRLLAVNGLIWKCAIKALKPRSTPNNEKSLTYTTAVNLRGRSSPPIPSYSIGNIISLGHAVSQYSEDIDIGLESLVTRLKNSIDEIDGTYVEALKGENGSHKVQEIFNELQMFYSDENSEDLLASSTCNSGMYETDFGWGKPIWISFISVPDDADPNIPFLTNFVMLMDTKSGNGIEAWVTLRSEDMAIFERDPEMLEMALVDPSPLLQ